MQNTSPLKGKIERGFSRIKEIEKVKRGGLYHTTQKGKNTIYT